MKKIFKKTLGIILIVLGFLALITPFSPSSWLMLIGLEILGFGFLLEGRLSRSLRARFKPFDKIMTRFERKFRGKSREKSLNIWIVSGVN